MEGFTKCSRISLMVANGVFFVTSALALGFGIFSAAEHRYLEMMIGIKFLESAGLLMIAIGALGIFGSLFGFIAAYKMNRCMLVFYFVDVLLLFILVVVSTILSVMFRYEIRHEIDHGLTVSLREYSSEQYNSVYYTSWNDVQKTFKCCGLESGEDWRQNNEDFKNSRYGERVPYSCCQDYSDCTYNPDRYNSYFNIGCRDILSGVTRQIMDLFIISGIASGIIMLLILISTAALFRSTKDEMIA